MFDKLLSIWCWKIIEIRDWTREVLLISWFHEYVIQNFINALWLCKRKLSDLEIMQFWLGQFANAKMCKCIFESIVECILWDFKSLLKFPLLQYPILIVHWICSIFSDRLCPSITVLYWLHGFDTQVKSSRAGQKRYIFDM